MIRWARPSTIAVLPTPGSPIRTGLFFVRRLRTWMTRRISSSRPITGIELAGPRLGGQVAAVLLEGLVGRFGVGRGDPLAAAHALERLEDRLPAGAVALEEGLRLAAGFGDAEEQVLGRDVFVGQPAGLFLGPLDHPLGARVEGDLATLDAGAPGEQAGQLVAEGGQVDAEPAERLGRHAVVGLDEGGQDVLRIEDRAVEVLGVLLGGDDRLLGLLGETVKLHRWYSL